jgi:hypothetical protein
MKNPFITHTTKIGPLTLRNFVAMDCINLAQLNLQGSDLETLLAMVWMAAQSVEDVEQAVADNTAEAQIKTFVRTLPFSLMVKAKNWAMNQQEMQEDAKVDIIEQGSSIDTNTPPN